MKTTSLMTLTLLAGAALASFSYAGEKADAAVSTAADAKASAESIALAATAAVKANDGAPATLLKNILAQRANWTAAQVTYLYKSILVASGKSAASEDGVALQKVVKDAGYTLTDTTSLPEASIEVAQTAATTGTTRATRRTAPAKPTPPAVSTDN